MNSIGVILLVVYIGMLQRLFKVWFKFLEQDSSLLKEEKRLSWLILIISSLFWPIVVPISCLRLLETKLEQKKTNLDAEKPKDTGYYSDKTLPIVVDSVKC